jgi:hypothetical protein
MERGMAIPDWPGPPGLKRIAPVRSPVARIRLTAMSIVRPPGSA